MASYIILCSNVGTLILLLAMAARFAVVSCNSDEKVEGEISTAEEAVKVTHEEDVKITEEQLPANPFLDEEEINLPYAKEMYQGDIILTPEQKRVMGLEDGAPKKHVHERAVVKDSVHLWRNGVVPYVFHSSISSSVRAAINRAMQEYRDETCIRFVARSRESSYIRFIRGNGCYSYIGRTGQVQDISIGDGCQYQGIIMHELFHALGRWHEHSRPDRDNYITVNYQNIRDGLEDQFAKVRYYDATTNGISYDYSSVMHYSAYAFSKDRSRPTIVPRNSAVSLNMLGQRNGLSSRDLQHIQELYCKDLNQWSSWSPWSSCSTSCGAGTQRRTRSCQGSGCSGPSTDTRTCNSNNPCPSRGEWGVWGPWTKCSPSCGENRRQSRSRRCLIPGTCTGASTGSRSCRSTTCGGAGGSTGGGTGFGAWSQWTPCRAFCVGFQYRQRQCVQRSLGCINPEYQFRRCSTQCLSRADESQFDNGAGEGLPNSAGLGLSAISMFIGCAVLLALTLIYIIIAN